MKGVNDVVVADASVLLKWCLNEEENTDADELKGLFLNEKLEIWVPEHFFVEIGNVIARVYPDESINIFQSYINMGFKRVPISLSSSSLAFELMKKFEKISFYDALYHAVALKYGIEFLTFDKKYYEQTKSEGNIRLLK